MALFRRTAAAPQSLEDRERREMLKERQGIVYHVSLLMLSPAILFDALAAVIIAFSAFAQFSPLANIYNEWAASTTGSGYYSYVILQAVVLFAVPIAAVESMLMTFPQLGVIEHRIEAMHHNPSKKIRNEKMPLLKKSRARVIMYAVLAAVPLLLFRVDYFTSQYKSPTKTVYSNVTTTVHGKRHTARVAHTVPDPSQIDWTGLFKILGLGTDAVAPILSILVLTRMENEGKHIDAQEHAVRVTQNAVVGQIGAVAAQMAGGKITKQQALMLRRSNEGDLVKAIDAAVERDMAKKWYTITEICRDKLHVDPDPKGGDYRKVTNIVKRADDNGDEGVFYDDSQGRGKWLVAGDAIDRLFEGYRPSVKKDPATVTTRKQKRTPRKQKPWVFSLTNDRSRKKPLDGDSTLAGDEVAQEAS